MSSGGRNLSATSRPSLARGLTAASGLTPDDLDKGVLQSAKVVYMEGYLFDQFTTAIWNHRSDKYGGDLKGRLTLAIEVLEAIKQNTAADYPVQYRFGLKHYIKGLHAGALPGEIHDL
mgnify:CR=1 FL=1